MKVPHFSTPGNMQGTQQDPSNLWPVGHWAGAVVVPESQIFAVEFNVNPDLQHVQVAFWVLESTSHVLQFAGHWVILAESLRCYCSY